MGGLAPQGGATPHGGGAGYATAPAAEPGRHPRLPQDPVYIVGAARSPLGAFMGGLSTLSATDLGAAVIKVGATPLAAAFRVPAAYSCTGCCPVSVHILGQAPADV